MEPSANYVESIAAYELNLRAAGFEEIRIEDATELCAGGFCRALEAWARSTPSLDRAGRDNWHDIIPRMRAGVSFYLLAFASKPE